MLATPLLLLAAVLAPEGDSPTLAFEVESASSLLAHPEQRQTAFAGALAVELGELRVGFGLGARFSSYVRGWDRVSGVESWRRDFEQAQALAVTTNAGGGLVFALLRTEPEGGAPGSERLVVLSGATGATLYEEVAVLAPNDPFAYSTVESLTLSPSGLTLYRMEFVAIGATMRLRAIDTTSHAVRWEVVRNDTNFGKLAVALDSSGVFVKLDVEPSFDDRDVELVRFSAVDGTQQWSTSIANAGISDFASAPVPTSDGAGVALVHWVLPTTTGSIVERFSAATGASDWTVPSSLVPINFGATPVSASPGGHRLAVAQGTGFSSHPNGTELAVECFDLDGASLLWSTTYSGPILSDDPRLLKFDASGDRLFVLIARQENTFGQEQELQIRAIDAATGVSPWVAPLHPIAPGFPFTSSHWMDAPVSGGSTLHVSAGWTDYEEVDGLTRTALSNVDGAQSWSFTTHDELPSGVDPVARVWRSNDGQSLWTWPLEVDGQLRPVGLRLDQRSLVDGALLQSIAFPDTSLTSAEFAVSFSPFADVVALRVPIAGTFDEQLVLVDLVTATTLFELQLTGASNSLPWAFVWTPDGTRLYVQSTGTAGRLHAVDLASGTVSWQRTVSVGFGFGFESVSALGLVVDSATNEATTVWRGDDAFSGVITLELRRHAATDGAPLWSHSAPGGTLGLAPYTYLARAFAGNQHRFGARHTGLYASADETRAFLVHTVAGAGNVFARVEALDPSTGNGLWGRSGDVSLGFGANIVDAAVTKDGRWIHVLAQGSLPGGGEGAYVQTVDASTGALVWNRFLDEPVERPRGLQSLGNGLRLQVGVTRDLGDGLPGGALLVTLDAETGEELARSDELAARRELCDFVSAADGTTVSVGQGARAGALPVGLTRLEAAARLQDGVNGVSVASGGTYPLHLDFGAEDAGRLYLLAGSATGSAPPTPFAGLLVPLVLDSYTLSTLNGANLGHFQSTLGLLDSAGDARGRIVVPAGLLGASVVGATVHHAAIVFDPGLGQFVGVTQAVSTTILP